MPPNWQTILQNVAYFWRLNPLELLDYPVTKLMARLNWLVLGATRINRYQQAKHWNKLFILPQRAQSLTEKESLFSISKSFLNFPEIMCL